MTDRLVRQLALTAALSSVGAVGLTAGMLLSPTARNWFASTSPAYAVGETFDLPSDLYAHDGRTVVIFASVSCVASVRSAPGFKSLVTALRADSVRVVLLTGVHAPADHAAFAKGIGLGPADHLRLDLGLLRVRTVPSLVLVDKTGTVRLAREGFLSEADASAVSAAVRGLSSGHV